MKTAKRPSDKLRWCEICLLLLAAVFLLSGTLALGTQSRLADKVVRLHVLANSDEEADQALKLRVRDAVLARTEELLRQSADRREAEASLRGELLELERIAAEEIAAAGYDYPVTAELTDTRFPTREYDGFTLPAGQYLALRIVTGREPAGTGGAWCSRPFAPLRRRMSRQRLWPRGWKRRSCASSQRRTAAMCCGSRRWSGGSNFGQGWRG